MSLAGTGFLKRVTDLARTFVDEVTTVKFTDAMLLTFVRDAWSDLQSDLNRVSAFKIRARADITVVADQREYVLPPNVGAFLSLEHLDADGNSEWEIIPTHPLHPRGPGFTIEGPMLRLDPSWSEGEVMTLVYTPNAEVSAFEGVAEPIDNTVTRVCVDSVVSGAMDPRPYAYNGYVINLLDATALGQPTATRVVRNYETPSGWFEVAPAWSAAPNGRSLEVLPGHCYRCERLIALMAGQFMAAVIKDADRSAILEREIVKARRTLRLDLAQGEQRRGPTMKRTLRRRRRLGL